MTRLKLLTATAALAAAFASPALAQQMEPVATYHYNNDYNRGYDRRDSGFWPGEVAAGVVGGAIGTAAAIATAPLRGDAYAYDNGPYDNGGYYNGNGYNGRAYDNSYGARNGFVCQPGTLFRGEDGRRHICQ